MRAITIAGNVGQSELKDHEGTPLLAFSIAVRAGRDKTIWFDVGLFGKRATSLAQYVQKGAFLVVSGDLDVYEASSGKTYLKVRANEVTLGPKREQAPQQGKGWDDPAPQGGGAVESDIPF